MFDSFVEWRSYFFWVILPQEWKRPADRLRNFGRFLCLQEWPQATENSEIWGVSLLLVVSCFVLFRHINFVKKAGLLKTDFGRFFCLREWLEAAGKSRVRGVSSLLNFVVVYDVWDLFWGMQKGINSHQVHKPKSWHTWVVRNLTSANQRIDE